MTDTYIVTYLNESIPDEVEADFVGSDMSDRVTFWAERPSNDNKIVLSVLSSQVLAFGLKEEPPADDTPPKPEVKRPGQLSLFKVEYTVSPAELFWAEDCVRHGDHYDFHVTSVVGSRFAIRSIYAQPVENITAIRLPEGE